MSSLRASQSQPQQNQEQPEWYRVFRPELDTVAFDPLDPAKRYHEGVFVEADPMVMGGTLFHVTGNVITASGMKYEEKEDYIKHFRTATQIGWVHQADFHSRRISGILSALPRPTKQQGINFWEVDPETKRHEIIWTKENGERYGPGEQRRPVIKCSEWTSLFAIPALHEAGILKDNPP